MQLGDLRKHIYDQRYWYEEYDGRFTVNCSGPWDEPTDMDRSPGSGSLGVLYVSDGVLHFEWRWDNGYDEHWQFSTIGEFADFYDKFLTYGISGLHRPD